MLSLTFQIQALVNFGDTHWLLNLSLPEIAIAFIFVLFYVLRTWLGFPSVMHELHLWPVSYRLSPVLMGNG